MGGHGPWTCLSFQLAPTSGQVSSWNAPLGRASLAVFGTGNPLKIFEGWKWTNMRLYTNYVRWTNLLSWPNHPCLIWNHCQTVPSSKKYYERNMSQCTWNKNTATSSLLRVCLTFRADAGGESSGGQNLGGTGAATALNDLHALWLLIFHD